MGRAKKPCYFCGSPSTSAEHVPPKQIFKGLSVDPITVPACDKHNTDKSGEDDAVVKGMLRSVWENQDKYKVHPHVHKVLGLIEPHFERVKRKVEPFSLLSDPPSGFDPTIAHLHGSVKIANWMTKLTAALVYDGIGYCDPSIQWSKAGVFSPEWFEGDSTPKDSTELYYAALDQQRFGEELERDDWKLGWTSGPRAYPMQLYNFQVALTERDRLVTFRHHFFQSFRWFVLFYTSEATFTELERRVRQESAQTLR